MARDHHRTPYCCYGRFAPGTLEITRLFDSPACAAAPIQPWSMRVAPRISPPDAYSANRATAKKIPAGLRVTCPGDRTRVRVDHDSAARGISSVAPESVRSGSIDNTSANLKAGTAPEASSRSGACDQSERPPRTDCCRSHSCGVLRVREVMLGQGIIGSEQLTFIPCAANRTATC